MGKIITPYYAKLQCSEELALALGAIWQRGNNPYCIRIRTVAEFRAKTLIWPIVWDQCFSVTSKGVKC